MEEMTEVEWQKHLKYWRILRRAFIGLWCFFGVMLIGIVLFAPKGFFPGFLGF